MDMGTLLGKGQKYLNLDSIRSGKGHLGTVWLRSRREKRGYKQKSPVSQKERLGQATQFDFNYSVTLSSKVLDRLSLRTAQPLLREIGLNKVVGLLDEVLAGLQCEVVCQDVFSSIFEPD